LRLLQQRQSTCLPWQRIGDQQAGYRERGGEQRLHRTHAFGHEPVLPFAALPTLQVTGECE
jgi:hypothetical protein